VRFFVALVLCAGCKGNLNNTEFLGKQILFDTNLSANRNQACATCHGAEVGGTGPEEAINVAGAVYEGSIAGRFGNRKPPATNYAPLAPVLDFGSDGTIRGGNFWDGRATGWNLNDAATDQAQGPFINPLEQALPDGHEVVVRVCASSYSQSFTSIYGASSCQDTDQGYDNVARAVAAYEASSELTAFKSRYDAFLAGRGQLSALETQGLALFQGKAHCTNCHPSPAFTDFTFDNLGVPVNPQNPFLSEDTLVIDNMPVNPLGPAFVDEGLGGFLNSLRRSNDWRSQPYVPVMFKQLSPDDLGRLADDNRGKMRVPTLRNVDKRPRPDFIKAYTHNGYFKSLASLVHFYNTRDVLPACASQLVEADALAQDCWPPAEIPETVNHAELGSLGLTSDEEAAIVAFLGTLSDE
jgi:cytochrome c peroxidase